MAARNTSPCQIALVLAPLDLQRSPASSQANWAEKNEPTIRRFVAKVVEQRLEGSRVMLSAPTNAVWSLEVSPIVLRWSAPTLTIDVQWTLWRGPAPRSPIVTSQVSFAGQRTGALAERRDVFDQQADLVARLLQQASASMADQIAAHPLMARACAGTP
jgi:hypothetical protein